MKYQAKGGQSSRGNDRGGKGTTGRYNNDESPKGFKYSDPKKSNRTPVNSEAIKKIVGIYFTSYYKRSVEEEDDDEEKPEGQTSKAPDFNVIKKYVEETTADPADILYCLLTSIVEEKYEMIE